MCGKSASQRERKSRKTRTEKLKVFLCLFPVFSLIQLEMAAKMFFPRSRLFFFRRASKKILDSCTTLTIKKRRSKARNFLLSVAKHNNKIVENKVSGLSGTMQFILFLPSDFFFLYLRIHKKSSDEVLRQSRRKTMTLNYNLVRTKSRTALLHYVINW